MSQQVHITDEYVAPRAPVTGSVALATDGVHIGETITSVSHVPWELFCESDWFVGDADGQLRPVAADVIYTVPSGKLTGWYAKSALGTPTLYAMGAARRS